MTFWKTVGAVLVGNLIWFLISMTAIIGASAFVHSLDKSVQHNPFL